MSSRSSRRSSPACRSSGSRSRIDNISTTGFRARLPLAGELAGDQGRPHQGPALHALADHGAFNSHVSATKLPAGLLSASAPARTTSRRRTAAVDAVYTNKAPGGVAYRCSLRVTEAVYLIERMIDVLAQKLGIDKAEIRRRNFVKPRAVPLHDLARLDARQRQLPRRAGQGAEGGGLRGPAPRAGREARPKGETDGHRRRHLHRDRRRRADQGLRHPRHRPVRQLRDPRPSDRRRDRAAGHDERRARATRPPTRRSSPPRLGLPASDIVVEEGDTDKAPYGAGTWGSRSTPVAGAAAAQAARKIRDKARKIAAHLLEVRRGRPRMGDRPLQGQGQPERRPRP